MDNEAAILANRIKVAAAHLFAQLRKEQRIHLKEINNLDLLIREAQTREHRRAAFNERDRACYRLGGAFEAVNSLGIDDVAVTGFLALGPIGLVLLAEQASVYPGLSIAELLIKLVKSSAGPIIRANGVLVQWNRLRELYLTETTRFQASKKGRDLTQRWRSEQPTTNQRYLVGQICHLLQLELRSFPDRGAAFEWIDQQAGNPRFNDPPPKPDLAALQAVFR